MPRHLDAILDGVPLSSVGPFLLQAAHEDAPTLELTEGERPGRPGTLLLSRKRQQLKVAIEVAVRELYDLTARSHYLEAMAAWANGVNAYVTPPAGSHYLELTSRPDRRLLVACTADPTLGSVRDYTSVARAEFTAYTVPYWEDLTEYHWAMASGSTGSANLIIPGTAPAPLCLTVTPKSGTLTAFSVTAGGRTISLTNLSVSTSSVLSFDRDALDNISVFTGSSLLLSHRTAESDDDLFVGPGPVSLSYTANVSVDVVATVRGRWL